ncbi:two-component system OmpR family sensor kinase [Motilibacter peucedani]|uniref:histidine kinase n=1 Tax=Motilibacter peucedani TaxID=598650 RepID=A0A420XQT7_9ACTN|nr:HAMP domain-containing sensor histidine kinase [Motilibacter peucedani]RKS75607.1 two-component system OmpR family sensor kinase [Motilibacter peucedani]
MRLPGRSLRARLLLLLSALLAVACLGIGTLSVVAINSSLRHQLDQQLTQTVGPGGGPGGREREAERETPCGFLDPTSTASTGPRSPGGQRPDTILGCVYGGTVHALVIRSGTARTVTDDATLLSLSRRPAGITTAEVEGLGDYRFRVSAGRDGSVVILGLPLREVTSQVWKLAREIAVVSLVALLLALALAWQLLRRALAPLQRVAATAARVSRMPLDQGEVALSELVPARDADPHTEIGQVGSALNRLLTSVGSALNARHASETRVRQFVADASHELRTPLAAIRGYAELTRRGRDELPSDTAYAMSRVESEAARMTTLVEDLLLLARLDAGRPLAAERVDLTSLVVDALSDAHAVSQDHRWTLDVPDEPVEVVGDPSRLHQVVANLLGNARTHTPPGTEVCVGLRRQGDEVTLLVRDDGPGIAPELRDNVFERFARGDSSRSRAAGSTGLGLAIVAAIVSAHTGRVEVDSGPGRTEFRVVLPAA